MYIMLPNHDIMRIRNPPNWSTNLGDTSLGRYTNYFFAFQLQNCVKII